MSNLGSRNKGQGTIDRQTRRSKTKTVEQPVAVVDEEVEVIPDMTWLKLELVDLAKSLGVSSTGTKQEIVDRLTE